ncbi:addiction module protein [Methylomonas sp. MV1]|uniref:addiction module protein n=1 Tax=Methylomonas sp. MV1 TaxID=3073620 RepID=UPI0028A36942|nr:addiction module protein [Methylomonas sp. MV1]MDT4329103.1 addiction module protein [Methylomonas sp. MV1]
MISAELKQLSAGEKLKLIEALWQDLLEQESDLPELDWHREVLEGTAQAYQAGEIEALDWQAAKNALRAEFE